MMKMDENGATKHLHTLMLYLTCVLVSRGFSMIRLGVLGSDSQSPMRSEYLEVLLNNLAYQVAFAEVVTRIAFSWWNFHQLAKIKANTRYSLPYWLIFSNRFKRDG